MQGRVAPSQHRILASHDWKPAPCLSHPLQKEGITETEELSFDFRRQRFVYDPSRHAFEKLRFPDKVGGGECGGDRGGVGEAGGYGGWAAAGAAGAGAQATAAAVDGRPRGR